MNHQKDRPGPSLLSSWSTSTQNSCCQDAFLSFGPKTGQSVLSYSTPKCVEDVLENAWEEKYHWRHQWIFIIWYYQRSAKNRCLHKSMTTTYISRPWRRFKSSLAFGGHLTTSSSVKLCSFSWYGAVCGQNGITTRERRSNCAPDKPLKLHGIVARLCWYLTHLVEHLMAHSLLHIVPYIPVMEFIQSCDDEIDWNRNRQQHHANNKVHLAGRFFPLDPLYSI